MSQTLDKFTVDFWRNKIVPGKTVIALQDKQAIQDSLKDEGHAKGTEHVVQGVRIFRYANSDIEYRLYDLGIEDEDHLFLLVKIVGDVFDLRILFADPSFTPGNRHDMLNNDTLWMFNEPEDLNAFEEDPEGNMNTCKYTSQYIRAENDNEFPCNIKQQGELYCRDENDQMVTIVEYLAEGECENPESMFIEEGDSGTDPDVEDDGSGGWISHYIGCNITEAEIEIW